MKKISTVIIALLVSVILVPSCKKSSPAATYSMTANVAGSTRNFNLTPPIAITTTLNGATDISITGVLSQTTGESIILQLGNLPGGGPIVAGTYSDTAQNYVMAINYVQSQSAIYQAGTIVEGFAAGAGVTIANPLKIVISSINSSSIQGSFSGDFYVNGDPTTPKLAITGNFYAKFQ